MKAGDLVLVRFPQADLSAGKLRPALVIALAPGRHPDVLLALVTSQVRQAVPQFDELLSPTDTDFPDTHLKASSLVRLARLATVDRQVIAAKLESIEPSRLEKIRQRLIVWLQG